MRGYGSTQSTTGSAADVAEPVPPGRGHRRGLLVGRRPPLLAPPIAEAFTTLAVAAAATTRPHLGTCVLQLPLRASFRRGQAGHRPPTALRRALRPRAGRGHPRDRVRAGRRRLPPPRAADGRGRRRPPPGLGRPRGGRRRLRPGAGVGTGSPVVRRRQCRRPPPGGRRRRRLGTPLPHPGRVRHRTGGPAARRRPRPAGIPRPCRRESSSSPVSGTTTRRPRGAPSGSPSSTACRPRPSSATWWRARPRPAPPRSDRYADAGARHILVMVAGSPAVEHFGTTSSGVRGRAAPGAGGGIRMSTTDVAILGTGMTDMSRRDQEPDAMAYEVVHEALGDAGVSAARARARHRGQRHGGPPERPGLREGARPG